MRYYGGKCYWGGWISTLLPKNLSGLYVEPFGGMLSVLLRREKAAIEIVNDLDRRLLTWWEIVRDRPDELVRQLDYTPYSRAVFAECAEICASPKFNDPLKLAWALTVILWQGYGAKNTRPNWVRHIVPLSSAKSSIFENIDILHRRLEYVQLDCCDACTLLEGDYTHNLTGAISRWHPSGPPKFHEGLAPCPNRSALITGTRPLKT